MVTHGLRLVFINTVAPKGLSQELPCIGLSKKIGLASLQGSGNMRFVSLLEVPYVFESGLKIF